MKAKTGLKNLRVGVDSQIWLPVQLMASVRREFTLELCFISQFLTQEIIRIISNYH
jgi:hypothetical protein